MDSLRPSVSWIKTIHELDELSRSVKSLVIQKGVGKKEKAFNLSNLPSLTTLEMRRDAYRGCHVIVIESMNDFLSNE